MSIERWDTTRLAEEPKDLIRGQSQFIEIQDTGAADSVNNILHGLARVPRGIRIVNAVLGSAGPVTWYRLDTDDPWTDRRITFRLWGTGNARVLLEVF